MNETKEWTVVVTVHTADAEEALEKARRIGLVVDFYPTPKDAWGEDPDYLRSDWRHEVGENDTSLGYWAWVEHEREVDEEDAAEDVEDVGG